MLKAYLYSAIQEPRPQVTAQGHGLPRDDEWTLKTPIVEDAHAASLRVYYACAFTSQSMLEGHDAVGVGQQLHISWQLALQVPRLYDVHVDEV